MNSCFANLLYFVFCLATAKLCMVIHSSILLAILSFFTAPLWWLVWVVMDKLNKQVFIEAFGFLAS